MKQLKEEGFLFPVVERVRVDHTLDLQIRSDEIHIYYRGGRLLSIKKLPDESFACHFDKNYCVQGNMPKIPPKITKIEQTDQLVSVFPQLKQIMDFFFAEKANKSEREFQQLVVRENNYSTISNSTDYFIVDIEYANAELGARFDLIGIKWESIGAKRKATGVHSFPPKIVFFEMKYHTKAIDGKAGINKHIADVDKFLKDANAFRKLQEEVLKNFDQKRKLGLVHFGQGGNRHKIDKFANRPEIILLIANYDPASKKLERELSQTKQPQNADLRVAVANFMGYGLYDENIYAIDEFRKKFLDK